MFKVDFYDPDIPDQHMVTVNWGDGSPMEPEGRILEDGTVTGPLLNQGVGGYGSVTAEHVFTQNGSYTVQICVTDQVSVDGEGNKQPTAVSQTTCHPISVTSLDDGRHAAGCSLLQPGGSRPTAGLHADAAQQPAEAGAGLTATGLGG
jgi:PKD repeat protein